MKISKDEILHIASLSRLRFDEQDLEEIGKNLERIVDSFALLDKVDVDNVPPTAHVIDGVNVLREDVAEPAYPRDSLLENAPVRDDEAYLVPQVLE